MYEIELKAHVENRKEVIERLNSFAEFLESVQKDDVYWAKFDGEKKIQARIRRETNLENNESKIYLTYKQKETRIADDGTSCEVNDEKECFVSDSAALEALFCDLGLNIVLKKQKSVMGWQYENAHIELCTVPPLGDFLEIEILADNNDENIVRNSKQAIISIFKKCGISEDKIENRYYSEMLRSLH